MADYFDLDTILAEEERIPTTFKTDAFKVGYLDPSDEATVRAWPSFYNGSHANCQSLAHMLLRILRLEQL